MNSDSNIYVQKINNCIVSTNTVSLLKNITFFDYLCFNLGY
jgi:hypothetical protein